MVKFKNNFITIFKVLKNIFSIILGFTLIFFGVLSYVENKGGFTLSDPSGFLISYLRFYDESVLLYSVIAGLVLIFYGFFYDRFNKEIIGGTEEFREENGKDTGGTGKNCPCSKNKGK